MSQRALQCLTELPPTTLRHAAKTRCKYCTEMAFTCRCQSLSDEEAVTHSEGEQSTLQSDKGLTGPSGDVPHSTLCAVYIEVKV